VTNTLFDIPPASHTPGDNPATDITGAPAFTVVVYGTPAPQGSKSFKGLSKKGHAILVESSKKVAPWREQVADAAAKVVRCCDDPGCGQLQPGFPLDGPLLARVVFTLQKPASAPKRVRTWPCRYPDASKLLRSTEDALSRLVWADDARVVEYSRLAKVFPGEDPEALPMPGAVISVWRVSA
jgi:Holliday junction resolvase RusA-like endonuclease